MRQISTFLLMSVLAVVIASCSTSQNTVGGSLQKRKYTKGFYHNKNHSFRSSREEATVTLTEETAIRPEATEAVVVTEQTAAQPVVQERGNPVILDQNTERGTQQKPDVNQKAPAKKKATSNSKPQKPVAPTRPRRERENDYFIPLKDKKTQQHSSQGGGHSDGMFILAVIFAILIPPIGVLIYTNIDWMKVLICLLLTLLFFLPGMIYALLVVFDVI